jgi:predicted nuclease of predicted toxin-antitoxin system
MRFLIDENVRKEVVDFLRAEGHDILIVPRGSSDDKVIQIAKGEKRIILTHDRHFANILLYPPEELSGIVRLKIHPPSASVIISALGDFLAKFTPERLEKKLIILEKDGFRIK